MISLKNILIVLGYIFIAIGLYLVFFNVNLGKYFMFSFGFIILGGSLVDYAKHYIK